MVLAERPGFEPGIGFDPYTGLANQRLRPLGHLSVPAIYTMLPERRVKRGAQGLDGSATPR